MLKLEKQTDERLNKLEKWDIFTYLPIFLLIFCVCFICIAIIDWNELWIATSFYTTCVCMLISFISIESSYRFQIKIKGEKINRRIDRFTTSDRYDDALISEVKYFISKKLDSDGISILYLNIEEQDKLRRNNDTDIIENVINLMIQYNYASDCTREAMINRINDLMDSISFTQKEISDRQTYLRKQNVYKLRGIYDRLLDLKIEKKDYNGITEDTFYRPVENR